MDPGRLGAWLLAGQLVALAQAGIGYAQPTTELHTDQALSPRERAEQQSPPATALAPPGTLESSPGELDRPYEPSASALLVTLDPPALHELATDALARNPDIARARYRAAAAASRAPQVRALPDPMAGASLFLLPPETRVGPQLLSASLQQRFPWFGKLALRERAALLEAAEAEADVETRRLDVLTETRRLYYELAFLEAQAGILEAERETLVRFESLAQARYASGAGLQQEIVRIQAQITTTDTKLLQISERRASLLAAVNTLRDRPAETEVSDLVLPEPGDEITQRNRRELVLEAFRKRPEVAAVDAHIAARQAMIELAEKNRRPDVTLGLSYTLVGKREDAPGRATPPPDNGDDILALTGSVNLPVRTRRLDAELAEARANRFEAEEARRHLLAGIEGATGDLLARLPLLSDHFRLLDSVLSVQAREALRSAETAYATGKLNAVDLLDAEVVLFEVEIAIARTQTDWNVAVARLERALAAPLSEIEQKNQNEPTNSNPQQGARP